MVHVPSPTWSLIDAHLHPHPLSHPSSPILTFLFCLEQPVIVSW